jgi:hypothetical protein
MVKRALALSMVSTPKTSISSIEPTSEYIKSDKLSAMPSTSIGSSVKEVSPFLASWMYNISKVLHDTTLSVSGVSTPTSISENIVSRALLQPISSVEAPWSLASYRPDLVPWELELTRKSPMGEKTGKPSMVKEFIKPPMVEAFKLPQIVTSLVVELSKKYNLVSGGPEISESMLSTVELMKISPEETLAEYRRPEAKPFSKLLTLVSLASTASLIAYKLQQESTMLMTGMQTASSLPETTLSGLGTLSPVSTSMVKKMAVESRLSPHRLPPTSTVPVASRRPITIRRESPTVQNKVNITVAADSKDEDLRDLERKISRILSEQIRRHYGSTRF